MNTTDIVQYIDAQIQSLQAARAILAGSFSPVSIPTTAPTAKRLGRPPMAVKAQHIKRRKVAVQLQAPIPAPPVLNIPLPAPAGFSVTTSRIPNKPMSAETKKKLSDHAKARWAAAAKGATKLPPAVPLGTKRQYRKRA